MVVTKEPQADDKAPADILEATHLPTKAGGLEFHNPFIVGSGPTVKTLDMIRQIDEAGWGAAAIKLTIDPEPYINREPRYRWWKKTQLHTFTAEKRIKLDEALRLAEGGRKFIKVTKLFSNITYENEDIEGWVKMAKAFENVGIDANELNMCCPNMSFNVEVSGEKIAKCTGASMGMREDLVAAVVKAVKAETKVPLCVKITPEGGRIALVAKAAFEAGADMVASVGNRLGIPPIDLQDPTASPFRHQQDPSITCLSGPWLKPLALRDVFEARKMVGPHRALVGYGGMSRWNDYIEMSMMGADLVGMCTETMIRGYNFLHKEIARVKKYMEEHNIAIFKSMRDTLVPEIKTAQTLRLGTAVAKVQTDTCTGCELCIPIGHCYAITMIPGAGHPQKNRVGKVALVDPYKCTACSTCLDVCPFDCFKWEQVPADRVGTPV